MMELNWIAVFVAALIPLAIGFIYYHPKVLGNAWVKEVGMTEADMQGANMLKIFGLTFLFSLFLASTIMPMVIHQFSVYSLFADDPSAMDATTESGAYLADFMSRYGDKFKTFQHGAFHGGLSALFFAMPILGINALFERRSFKYILIHTGYWVITLALMGGLICAWL